MRVNIGNSFNSEWVKTKSKDEFLQHCKTNHPDMSEATSAAYYDSVVPPVKAKAIPEPLAPPKPDPEPKAK